MNTNECSEPKRVLIFEHPHAIPSVVTHLKRIEEKLKIPMQYDFATSCAEAEARLQYADIAIIDVDREGRDIAAKAITLGIPTIATSLFFEPTHYLNQSDRLKMVAKPQYYNIAENVKSLLDLIKSENGAHSFAA